MRNLLLALPLAVAVLCASPAPSANDYPTEVIADYVLACMAANNNTAEALRQCSCSIDVLASLLDYQDYSMAETVLRMRQVADMVRGKPVEAALGLLYGLQLRFRNLLAQHSEAVRLGFVEVLVTFALVTGVFAGLFWWLQGPAMGWPGVMPAALVLGEGGGEGDQRHPERPFLDELLGPQNRAAQFGAKLRRQDEASARAALGLMDDTTQSEGGLDIVAPVSGEILRILRRDHSRHEGTGCPRAPTACGGLETTVPQLVPG